MSLVSENVMHGADALVVPLLPSPLSVRTLEQLFEFVGRKGWTDLTVLPFFSMVDRRKALHKETVDSLRQRFPSILATEVPYGSDFERLTLRRAPVEAYAPGSAAAEVYRLLWREIEPIRGRSSRRGVPSGPGAARVRAVLEIERDLELVEVDLRERRFVAWLGSPLSARRSLG